VVKLSTSQARKDFSSVVDAAYAKSERIVLMRNGKSVAAIVPIEDLEALEAYENAADAAAVKQALAEQGDKPAESWERVKAELGLG